MIINWYGSISQGQGYSGASERMVIALEKAGADIRLVQFTPSVNKTPEGTRIAEKPFALGDVGISFTFPNGFSSMTNKYKIGYTMFETDTLPHTEESNEWSGITGNPIDAINKVDMLFVPCRHNRWLFKKSGVTVPIEVVPQGVNTSYFPLFDRPKRDTFTFLMLGTLTIRKNVGAAITAFLEAFRGNNNVRLVIKTQSGTLGALNFPNDPNIIIIDELTPIDKLIKYYEDADCFLFPSRGEGFGLPPMEAMATGLPVILSNNTGLADYCDNRYNYPIPCWTMTKAQRFPVKWGNVGLWYEPDIDCLIDTMKYVESHREEAKAKGMDGAKWVREVYNYDNTAKTILSNIDKLLSSF